MSPTRGVEVVDKSPSVVRQGITSYGVGSGGSGLGVGEVCQVLVTADIC
jgi:hypothetical protein